MKTDDTRGRRSHENGTKVETRRRHRNDNIKKKIVATTTTYLDVRDRINRGDARGRAKRGIDGSIHVCVLFSACAGKKKCGDLKGCWEM